MLKRQMEDREGLVLRHKSSRKKSTAKWIPQTESKSLLPLLPRTMTKASRTYRHFSRAGFTLICRNRTVIQMHSSNYYGGYTINPFIKNLKKGKHAHTCSLRQPFP